MINPKRIFQKEKISLLREMIRTDFKLRYQNSAIGYLWSLLKPLLVFAILYAVFTQVLRIGADIPGYPVYLLTGVLMWSFFAETTNKSVTSVVAKGNLIRKINIPKYLIVVASAISSLINLGLSLIVLTGFIIFTPSVTVTPELLYLVPLLIAQLFVLATATSFILAAMYVKFRDISYIWEVVLQAGFYATPIIYPLQVVPESIQKVLLLNPIAQTIQDIRRILILPSTVQVYDVLAWPGLLFPFVATFLLIVIAVWYFKKQSIEFAENI